VARGPWPVARGPWPVARGPWPVARGPWPVARGVGSNSEQQLARSRPFAHAPRCSRRTS
jgi:hypothetical protein